MKTTLLIALLTLGLLPGMTPKAEAQHCSQNSQIYISGYQQCGTPIYHVRYLAGYDRCGNPVWRVRNAYRSEINRLRSNYQRSYHRGYSNYNGYNRHAGYGRTRISYSSSGGRNYSYSYYNGSSYRCR